MAARPARFRRAVALTLVLAALASCTPVTRSPRWASVRERTPEFLRNRAVFDPSLAAAPGGRVALTWVTRDTAGADAWIAVSLDSGATFAAAQRLNLRRGSVASFPESRPVVAFGPSGLLVVAWAAARDSERFADDIVTRASVDDGVAFGPERIVNDDHGRPGPAYHGFVALDVTARGRLVAAWLDGRAAHLAPGGGEPAIAEVWCATSDDAGARWSPNVRAAALACPCCRPALRASGTLVALAYRGVRDSLRDPRLALSRDGGATFTTDTLVSADGWNLSACPVDGPALSLTRDGGWLAWYTGARGRAGIHAAAWSAAAGAAGPSRALEDTLRDGAHAMLADMGAVTVAGMLARAGTDRRVLALRMLYTEREPSPWLLLGANARSAALAVADASTALAAWIEQGEAGPRLRLVRLTRS